MASLIKFARIINPLTSKNTGLIYNAVRSKGNTADWMPGPYPTTEEERRKAAEKYGLLPEEYEPYPDDGRGFGDYPKMPWVGRAAQDPFYPWDEPAHRRNYNETLHRDANIMGEDRIDAGVKQKISAKTAYGMFFGSVGLIVALWLVFEQWPTYPPVMEKQLPKPGVVHYTFEPAR